MKILFMLLPLVYILANIYINWRTLQMLSTVPLWLKVIVSIVIWVSALSLFISMGLRNSVTPEWILNSLNIVGSVWMAFLLYSVLLLVVSDIVRIFVPSAGPSAAYALPLTVILLLYGYFNYRNPKIEDMELNLDKSFEGNELVAVAISDVHLGYGTGTRTLRRYVDLINEQKPDIIFIAGDLIDNSLNPLMEAPFDEVLNELNAPMGIYMVPGNHEYISGIEDCAEYLEERTGIRLLRDSIVLLPNGMQIIGRDDRSNRFRAELNELLDKADRSSPIIVLDHQPYDLAETDSLKVDIQISGHTHRGQLWPLNILVDRMYEQSHGYRKWNHSHIFVSSGLSLWGPPFRIGTDSDMGVIRIKGKEQI